MLAKARKFPNSVLKILHKQNALFPNKQCDIGQKESKRNFSRSVTSRRPKHYLSRAEGYAFSRSGFTSYRDGRLEYN